MIFDLKEKFNMTGKSDADYSFDMYGFGSFDELQEFFRDFECPGLYVFTKRSKSSVGDNFVHNPVYWGGINNFNNRNFATHHKRKEIEAMDVHSVGIMLANGISEEKRKEMEADLLS